MALTRKIILPAALMTGALALAACSPGPGGELSGGVVAGETYESADNPSGAVYYDDNGRAYRCSNDIIFNC
ncbi:MAG: hypothetical protein AAF371_05945 [Pseudomonadota bacterium]